MSEWVKDSTLVFPVEVVGSVSRSETRAFAGISVLFRSNTADIPLTIVGSEMELRRFQKELDKAITKSLRELPRGV